MNITRGFLMMELAQERARRVSAERAVVAVNEHDEHKARQLARAHNLGWMEPEREQITVRYPHTNNDFCDDE